MQSHASTSTDTLKSKALAGIQLFGCKIIQRRLGLPSNSEAKYGCPNGRELEAVTHTQFTYPLPPPPSPHPPNGCAELKVITHNSSTPSPSLLEWVCYFHEKKAAEVEEPRGSIPVICCIVNDVLFLFQNQKVKHRLSLRVATRYRKRRNC